MKFYLKFWLIVAIGYAISRTERPIHRLETSLAGDGGVSDWYLIMRYVIGTGALGTALMMLIPDAWRERIGALFLVGAVGVGAGVGLGFLQNSVEKRSKV